MCVETQFYNMRNYIFVCHELNNVNIKTSKKATKYK